MQLGDIEYDKLVTVTVEQRGNNWANINLLEEGAST